MAPHDGFSTCSSNNTLLNRRVSKQKTLGTRVSCYSECTGLTAAGGHFSHFLKHVFLKSAHSRGQTPVRHRAAAATFKNLPEQCRNLELQTCTLTLWWARTSDFLITQKKKKNGLRCSTLQRLCRVREDLNTRLATAQARVAFRNMPMKCILPDSLGLELSVLL